MGQLFANFAYGTLASGITSGATSATLTTGHGARFPSPVTANGDFFYGVFEEASPADPANPLREIVTCTARSSDGITISRGQHGTTARAWTALDKFELRAIAADFSSIPDSTGVVKDYIGATAPAGYVLASGRTIGSAASGATERANADCYALFVLLWNSMSNTEAAVSSGRGANAAADWSANKTITLPDLRGRVVAGKDNMGGTTASRLTSASGITGTTLGAVGGTETHTLTAGQSGLPSHSHSDNYVYNAGEGGGTYTAGSSGSANLVISTTSTGAAGPSSASSAHQNTQPTLVLNKIIKL